MNGSTAYIKFRSELIDTAIFRTGNKAESDVDFSCFRRIVAKLMGMECDGAQQGELFLLFPFNTDSDTGFPAEGEIVTF